MSSKKTFITCHSPNKMIWCWISWLKIFTVIFQDSLYSSRKCEQLRSTDTSIDSQWRNFRMLPMTEHSWFWFYNTSKWQSWHVCTKNKYFWNACRTITAPWRTSSTRVRWKTSWSRSFKTQTFLPSKNSKLTRKAYSESKSSIMLILEKTFRPKNDQPTHPTNIKRHNKAAFRAACLNNFSLN